MLEAGWYHALSYSTQDTISQSEWELKADKDYSGKTLAAAADEKLDFFLVRNIHKVPITEQPRAAFIILHQSLYEAARPHSLSS